MVIINMKKYLYIFLLFFLSLNIYSQEYKVWEDKSYIGTLIAGEKISLTNNESEQFSFWYTPGAGDRAYVEGIAICFPTSNNKIRDFLKYQDPKVNRFSITLENGLVITNAWESESIQAQFTDDGLMINIIFPMFKNGSNELVLNNKTKLSQIMKWNDSMKKCLMKNNIASLCIEGHYKNKNPNSNDNYKIEIEITKPTTFIFNSLFNYRSK